MMGMLFVLFWALFWIGVIGGGFYLAVRFLRSVWLLTLVGTLLYVVALSAAVRGESFGDGLNPSGWFDLLDAGWAGRAAVPRRMMPAKATASCRSAKKALRSKVTATVPDGSPTAASSPASSVL